MPWLRSFQPGGDFLCQPRNIGLKQHILLMSGNFTNVQVAVENMFPTQVFVTISHQPGQLFAGAQKNQPELQVARW